MVIEEAKKELENRIIFEEGVLGIGIKEDSESRYIEVALKNKTIQRRYMDIYPTGQYKGHRLKFIIREQTSAQ